MEVTKTIKDGLLVINLIGRIDAYDFAWKILAPEKLIITSISIKIIARTKGPGIVFAFGFCFFEKNPKALLNIFPIP